MCELILILKTLNQKIMESTEQKATIITLSKESIILLIGTNYVQLDLNESCSELKMVISGESYSIYPGHHESKAIATLWRVLVPEAELDPLDKDYCDYCECYDCDCD